ncbi:glycoside hydrolase family 88 protein [Lacticaseibacillus daqingensis]|uniref:glycoside hydrolase family 88 protein n=1 Tax=Lacticaseibacillus daqingensis TaxID=2486014 RepID=UPI000F7AFDFB|nr:glycoside hydrolase family 88 protein [Lacticaseibacillus daqingensis]
MTSNLSTVLATIDTKLLAEIARLGETIPYAADGSGYGRFPKKVSWWTNGFWPGLMWQRYAATGNARFRAVAEQVEQRLDENFVTFTSLHHDVGFMYGLSAVADYQQTGNPKSRVRGLHAATILAGRYNPNGQFIRSWDDPGTEGWVIIDSMMNLPLLYWASETTGDPRFAAIAAKHAETVAAHHIRADGTVRHICVFDPNTGVQTDVLKGQGYAANSAWARGQAWAIAGFAQAYTYFGRPEWLRVATKVTDQFLTHVTANGGIPKLDLRQPAEATMTDTSALVAAATGIIPLLPAVPATKREQYRTQLFGALKTLLATQVNLDPSQDGILWGFSTAYDKPAEQGISSVYGDYYLVMALMQLQATFGDDCLQ